MSDEEPTIKKLPSVKKAKKIISTHGVRKRAGKTLERVREKFGEAPPVSKIKAYKKQNQNKGKRYN